MHPRSVFATVFVLVVLLAGNGSGPAAAQAYGPQAPGAAAGSSFTYQGELRQGGAPITAICNFKFSLWDQPGSGGSFGVPQTKSGVSVAAGRFTVLLNDGGEFGPDAFNGEARYLHIEVQCPPDAGFTPLIPRQALTAAPLALALPNFYTQQNPNSPNIIGGHSDNLISPGIVGATISGGGFLSQPNSVTGSYGVVGGGRLNSAGTHAVVSGGKLNIAGYYSVISGGALNRALSDYTVVSGGYSNTVTGSYGTIGGGVANIASGEGATVGGGGTNGTATVGNQATGHAATIGGGYGNLADDLADTVAGGINNRAIGGFSSVGGGANNQADYHSTVAGGSSNIASNEATVGGGSGNTAIGQASTVPGGQSNLAQGAGSFAAGSNAKALFMGDFVWADRQNPAFSATGAKQFLIRAAGGMGINTNAPGATLDVAGSFRVGGSVIGTVFSAIQAGTANVLSNTTASKVVTITFPSAFTALPRFIATARNDPTYFDTDLGDTFVVSVRRLTTTSVVLNIIRIDSASGWAQELRVDWLAWQ
jgi:hypothetical protein